VDDGVEAGAEGGANRVGVGEVAAHELGPVDHRLGVAGREVVEDGDIVAALDQLLDRDAPDVAGAAGDEDPHPGAA
jgi:hypothetical protein